MCAVTEGVLHTRVHPIPGGCCTCRWCLQGPVLSCIEGASLIRMACKGLGSG